VRAPVLAALDVDHERHLHPRASLDAARRAVLVEHHQSGWLTAPRLHCSQDVSHRPVTAVQSAPIRDRLVAVVQAAVARAQKSGALPTGALPDGTIERPARADQGAFATNSALRAKRAVGPKGPAPMDIAAAISAAIAENPPA